MKKRIVTFVVVLMLVLVYAAPAAAAPPCNGDETGREYAANHISPLAKAGALGNDGHVPGTHHGFSTCNPSGK